MTTEEKSFMKRFLNKNAFPTQQLATVGDADYDEIVRVTVKHDDGTPGVTRATILDKNQTCKTALTSCGPGFTEFPLDFPCLRWTPPLMHCEDDQYEHEDDSYCGEALY